MRTAYHALAFCLLATAGCAGGAGPTVGYVFDRGMSFGYEAGGSCGVLLKGNVGGTYFRTESGEIEAVHYLVYEPWFIVGGTAGFGYSSESGTTSVLGLWHALAYMHYEDYLDEGGVSGVSGLAVSAAFGVRWFAGVMEMYMAPKLGWAEIGDARCAGGLAF